MNIKFITLASTLILGACANNPEKIIQETKKGIEVKNIYASAETTPVTSTDDAADDPAIWVSGNNSRILGTDKQNGLNVYDMNGQIVQFLPSGRVNNIDIRQGVVVDNKTIDLAAASNRTDNSVTLYVIANNGKVSEIGRHSLQLPEPYGICMYKDANNSAHVFVNDKNGQYQQFKISSIAPITLDLVNEFKVSSQPEGCVADDKRHMLYFGEEEYGLWVKNISTNVNPTLIDQVDEGVLVADVEGVDIYARGSKRYLIVSSQGDFSYAVYDLNNNYDYKGSFRVIANEATQIDGTQETDGLTVRSESFSRYPEGLLVIQDGFNRLPKETQNFKYVDWREISSALGL